MRKIIFIFLITLFAISSIGCDTLHRKFVRKKKEKETSGVVPILEPEEYPSVVHSPEQRYRQHYVLWKVWDKELQETSRRVENDKKEKYDLVQMLEQLREMKKLVAKEKQPGLNAVIDEVENVNDQYNQPAGLRNHYSITKQLRMQGKIVRQHYSPDAIKKFLQEPEEDSLKK